MTVLRDLLDNATEIDGTYGNARVEWTKDYQTGECQPVIIWNENIRFHQGILREDEKFNLDTLAEQVDKALHDLFDGGDFNVDARWSDMDDEFDRDENGNIVEDEDGNEVSYPWIEIQVWPVLNHPLDQDEYEAMDFLWPAIATLFNVTDPGTWNSPYLYSGLQEKKPWTYTPTHVSVSDESTAMFVSQYGTTITLINEEGYSWEDPTDEWAPIEYPLKDLGDLLTRIAEDEAGPLALP